MNIKAIGVGAGAIIIALGGLFAYQVLRDSSTAIEDLALAPAATEIIQDERIVGAAENARRATPTPFGLSIATVGPRQAWTPSPTAIAVADGGEQRGAEEIEQAADAADAPTAAAVITGGGALGVAPTEDEDISAEDEEARRAERIRRLRAALPTPLPPYHTPTPTPEPIYFPTAVSRENSEAVWAGEFDWGSYESEGYRFMWVDEGESAHMLAGPGFVSRFDCLERLRLTLDEASNVAYDPFSHFIWVWAEARDGSRGCWGVPVDVDWRNMSPAREPISADEIESRRANDMDAPLLFGEANFHTPPLKEDAIAYGRILIEEDGWDALCHIQGLPWAVWDMERGFWALSDDDISVKSGAFFDEEEYEEFGEARMRGYYVIVNDGADEPEDDAYCWRVANADEAPVRPCYGCQLRDIEDVLDSEEIE